VSAEVDFAISENPHFRFFFVPQGVGELSADVVDNKELHFKATLPIGIDATLR
jgi:sulfur-oxidizing protein SoxY